MTDVLFAAVSGNAGARLTSLQGHFEAAGLEVLAGVTLRRTYQNATGVGVAAVHAFA